MPSNTIKVKDGLPPGSKIYTAVLPNSAGTTLTYSLAGKDAHRFSIDPHSGVVTIKERTDFELKTDYDFSVKVKSSEGHELKTQKLIVKVEDVEPDFLVFSKVGEPKMTNTDSNTNPDDKPASPSSKKK